jgi:multidrug transporter EmrE-like cation transporter
MAVDPETLTLAVVLSALIVGIHFRVLVVANRNVPLGSRLRFVNRGFAIWHGLGLAATIVIALLVKSEPDSIRWPMVPCGVNQFAAIAWWARSRAAVRVAERSPSE